MKTISGRIYGAWRRAESYSVPVTYNGMQKAAERLLEFSKGYEAGVRAASVHLERMHGENKKQHSFFLRASEAVRSLLD